MATILQKTNYIGKVRNAATQILEAWNDLRELKLEWDDTMTSELNDVDFTDINDGLLKLDIANVIGTTLDQLNTVLLTNHHSDNLHKIRK